MMQNERVVVVFDLDDTLYREQDFLKSAYHELAEWLESAYGLDDVYSQMLASWQQGRNAFVEIIAKYGLDLQAEDLRDRYRRHYPVLRLDDDTRRLLSLLKGRCPLGIITDGRPVSQRNKIAALGLQNWFADTDILISGETGFEKPAEEPFRFFMAKYPGYTYYYIGDNPTKDFVTPNRLGWTTVCLLDDGSHVHPQNFNLEESMLPRHQIKNMMEIETIIYG